VLCQIRAELPDLERRGVRWIEVGVAEAPGWEDTVRAWKDPEE